MRVPVAERQRIALRHPCFRAVEVPDPRYWLSEKAPVRGLLIRSGLTINK